MSFSPQMREQFTKLAGIEFGDVINDQVTVRAGAAGTVELTYKHDDQNADVSVHEKLVKLQKALQANGLHGVAKRSTLHVSLPDTAESVEALRIAKEQAAQARLTEMASTSARDMQEMLVNAGTDPDEARRRVHGALTAALPRLPRDTGVIGALSRRNTAQDDKGR